MEHGEIPLIPAQRMVLWNLNQDDPYTIRICDPHLDQPPRLSPRLADYRDPGMKQPPMLALHVTNLDPNRHSVSGRIGRPAADFKKPVAQEEN
jgi:hypothetical protein